MESKFIYLVRQEEESYILILIPINERQISQLQDDYSNNIWKIPTKRAKT